MRKNAVSFFLWLVLLLVLSGCSGGGDGDGGAAGQSYLNHWSGDWQNLDTVLDDPALDEVYEQIAESANNMEGGEEDTNAVSAGEPNYTAEDARWFMKAMYKTDFNRMTLDDGGITFFDEDGQVTCQGKYEYAGAEEVEVFGETMSWHQFEMPDPSDSCLGYRYLILTDVHTEGGNFTHFHFRYGGEGFDDLINNASNSLWWPTMSSASVSVEEVLEVLAEGREMQATFMLQSLGMWSGDWVSMHSYLDDPAMDSLYDDLAALLQGYTAAEVKSYFSQTLFSDFDGISVTAQGISFTPSTTGARTGDCGYRFAGVSEVDLGEDTYPFFKFLGESDDPSCPQYVITFEKGRERPGGMLHFYMRYGASGFEDLLDNPLLQSWWPTFIDPDTSMDDILGEVTGDLEEMASEFPPRVENKVDSQVLSYVTVEGGTTSQLTMPGACMEIEDGSEKFCICQAIAFRISQILSGLWADGVFRAYDVKIETGWNTDGPMEFWGPEKTGVAEVKYTDGITGESDLALADSWYKVTIISTGMTYLFRSTGKIYLENFLELRAKNLKGTATGDEKQRQKALRSQMVTIMKTLPFDEMFVIEQL